MMPEPEDNTITLTLSPLEFTILEALVGDANLAANPDSFGGHASMLREMGNGLLDNALGRVTIELLYTRIAFMGVHRRTTRAEPDEWVIPLPESLPDYIPDEVKAKLYQRMAQILRKAARPDEPA